MDNIYVRTDPAGNIKPDKEKSTERIDGAVATIMALDRALRNRETESVNSQTKCTLKTFSKNLIFSAHILAS